MDPESIGIEEARSALGDIVERVRLAGEHFVITRYGTPAAVLVPVEWHEQARAATKEEAP